MSDQPRVVIGLPVRNSVGMIRTCLIALLAQTYDNLEILVSDNDSDDGTTEAIAELAADGRIRHVRQDHNIGMLPNFEYVAREAWGEYFAWAAADDNWAPEFVVELVNLLARHPDAGVAMSSVRAVAPDGEEVDTIRFKGWSSLIGKPRWWAVAQMMNVLPGPPTHYYIYGIWRKPVLDQLMSRPFPRGRAGDRILMCEATLGTYLVDSDRVLHDRTVSEQGLAARYASDPLGAAWQDPDAERRYLLTLARRVLTSPLVPWHRRLGMALPFWVVLAVRRRRILWRRPKSS